ncbi:hypothetical protein CDIK_2989 [Cucumispora dikerogammari]|nr:hypothetical protein CDIK_2989 [Cucumispora dikerogammari]
MSNQINNNQPVENTESGYIIKIIKCIFIVLIYIGVCMFFGYYYYFYRKDPNTPETNNNPQKTPNFNEAKKLNKEIKKNSSNKTIDIKKNKLFDNNEESLKTIQDKKMAHFKQLDAANPSPFIDISPEEETEKREEYLEKHTSVTTTPISQSNTISEEQIKTVTPDKDLYKKIPNIKEQNKSENDSRTKENKEITINPSLNERISQHDINIALPMYNETQFETQLNIQNTNSKDITENKEPYNYLTLIINIFSVPLFFYVCISWIVRSVGQTICTHVIM